ncbi:UPF0587 protein [Tanacetum coccineum]
MHMHPTYPLPALKVVKKLMKLKCESCGEVTDKETCVSLNEEVDLPKRGVTNLSKGNFISLAESICKFVQYDIIRKDLQMKYPNKLNICSTGVSSAKGKELGFEPLEYAFSSDWEAQAVAGSKFGTKFVDIDLSGGDFSEYCEENKVPVMISNLRSEFRVVDMTKRIV